MDAEKLFLENLRRLPIDKIIGVLECYIAMNRTLRNDYAELWNENQQLKTENGLNKLSKYHCDVLSKIKNMLEESGV